MSFGPASAASAQIGGNTGRGWLRAKLALASYHATCFALSHPGPFRILFTLLRRLRPIAIVGNTVLVANGACVREVLDRFEDFTLGEVLGPRMPWGPFLLTLDWRQQHDRERTLLKSVVLRDADIKKIRCVAAKTCEAALDAATRNYAGRREIDLVQGLFEPVIVKVAADYFGITPIGRNQTEMMHVLRQIAGIAMVDPPPGSPRQLDAADCIDALTRHIKDLIAARTRATVPAPPAPPAKKSDLLSRLVTLRRATSGSPPWLDDDFIRRYVTGLATTGGATIVRASTHIVDRLLARPRALRHARKLVGDLDADLADLAELQSLQDPKKPATPAQLKALLEAERRVEASRLRLRQIAYEALRFRPMLPLLVRYAPRDTVIGTGSRYARRVKAGSTVIAAPLAVMFDPEQFESPRRFFSTRPVDDYVHFGFGPRTCFGKYVADTVILEVVRAVVALPGLARVRGCAGHVAYDGPVAHSLVVTFQRPAAGAGRP